MDSEKRKWCFQSIFLFLPFLIEQAVYPLFMKVEPQWLSIALFIICYTYVFYGLAIIVHIRWRKKIGDPIIRKQEKLNWKAIIIVLIIGVVFRRLESLVLGASQLPMLISEIIGYIKNLSPLWMGIAGLVLRELYYVFEFTLVTCIVDCAQKTGEKLGWSSRIPWGGIFLGLTWGLIHIISKGSIETGIACLLLSLVVGSVYLYFGKKPAYAWLCVAAAYLL